MPVVYSVGAEAVFIVSKMIAKLNVYKKFQSEKIYGHLK